MNNNNFFTNYKKYYKTINIILLLVLLMFSTFISIGYSTLNASFSVLGYLSRGQKWWIMTPGNGCSGPYGCARMFYFDRTYVDNSDSDASFGLRPSISLIHGIVISGGEWYIQ